MPANLNIRTGETFGPEENVGFALCLNSAFSMIEPGAAHNLALLQRKEWKS